VIVPGQRIFVYENPDQSHSSSEKTDDTPCETMIPARAGRGIAIEIHEAQPRFLHADRVPPGKGPQQLVD